MKKIDIKGYTLKEIQDMDVTRTVKLAAIRNTVEYLWYNKSLMAYNINVLPALEQAADREGLLFDLAGNIISVNELDHEPEPEEQWTCPACGALNPGGQHLCSKCGTQQVKVAVNPYAHSDTSEPEAPWVCPRCGNINPAGQYFCSTCGTMYVKAPINPDATDAASEQEAPCHEPEPEGPWTCPTCGTINPAGQYFCSQCGTQHVDASFNTYPHIKDTLDVTVCPMCGALIDEDTDTCPVCGSRIKEPAIDDTTCTGCSHFSNCECDANGIIADLEKKIEELERVIDMKDTIISNLYKDVTDLDEKAHRLTQTVDMLKAHVDAYNDMIDTCRKFNLPV